MARMAEAVQQPKAILGYVNVVRSIRISTDPTQVCILFYSNLTIPPLSLVAFVISRNYL
jgi:hypothetical protein